MKNKEFEIGLFRVKEPKLVLKLALVIDSYKINYLPKLWQQAEEQALTKVPTFKASEFFHQKDEHDKKTSMIFSFRYYTPESNREPLRGNNEKSKTET